MLKYLAVLLLIFGLTVYVSIQDERSAKQSAQKTAELHKAAVAAKPDEEHPQENIENTERSPPGWYSFFRWPNGTTTWAIILTLLALAEQTQAQIKMMKDKDRARLAVRPGGFGIYWCPMLESSLEISHSGPSEAFSISGVYRLVVTNSSDIPECEVWPIERTARQQLPSVIKPGSNPIVISCSIPFGNKEHDAVENGTGFLHFFGRLYYIDIYGEQRVTPFRYICEPQGGDVQVQWHERYWVRYGPESDNTPK